jgi:hypothetical protein
MNLIYRTDIVINAVEAFLEANHVPKEAVYSLEAVIYDQMSGWLEQILKSAVMPSYVVLDDDDYEVLSGYLKDIA